MMCSMNLKGFKEFVLKGNLVELAVAFIMATAFAKVVETFTGVLLGFIGKVGGEPNFDTVEIADVNVGLFLTALVSFLILAAVVFYFVVTPYNMAKERFFQDGPAAKPDDIILLEEIRNRCRGVDCEVLLVSPALVGSRSQRWASDIDEGLDLARERMARSVTALRGVGVEVRAEVGDPDPNMAIEDALRVFPADEIIISTLPPGESRWLEHDVVERTRREVDLPMTHVVVDLNGWFPAG